MISTIPIKWQDERGTIFNCDKLNLITRKKGTVSADHTHKESEVLFLIEGEIEFTLNNKTEILKPFTKIEIPSNIYHKLIALTDIKLLEYKF